MRHDRDPRAGQLAGFFEEGIKESHAVLLLLMVLVVWLLVSVPLARIFGSIAAGPDRHVEHSGSSDGGVPTIDGHGHRSAELHSTATNAVQEGQQERRHEVTAALLGIEAAAQGLSRHRALLTEPELDELSDGLVAEIHRVRSLIDLRNRESVTSFDLREAIVPVLVCTKAAGVELIDAVPAGIEVVGIPSMTVEACATLLRNAQDHAPGSPIEVRAEVAGGVAVLSVDDRGPGFAPAIADALFERSVRSESSDGSGLGLYIARRLMDEQNGSIRAERRPGGGASVVLELPLARTAALVTA
jgi:signal transduction histidine kinase